MHTRRGRLRRRHVHAGRASAPTTQQFLQQRELSAREVARIFRVPAWAIDAPTGDSLTYANVAEQNRALVDALAAAVGRPDRARDLATTRPVPRRHVRAVRLRRAAARRRPSSAPSLHRARSNPDDRAGCAATRSASSKTCHRAETTERPQREPPDSRQPSRNAPRRRPRRPSTAASCAASSRTASSRRDLGGWREVIDPGALDGARLDDLVATRDHDRVRCSAATRPRSTSRTATTASHWAVELPDSPVGEDVRDAVERGDLRAGELADGRRSRPRGTATSATSSEIAELRDVTVDRGAGVRALLQPSSAPNPT